MTLERGFRYRPGYDNRPDEEAEHVPRGKRTGCTGGELVLSVTGGEGTVVAIIGTNWLPSWVSPTDLHVERAPVVSDLRIRPYVAQLQWHWDRPWYLDQAEGNPTEECRYRPDGCWSDVSFINGDPVLGLLITEGDEAAYRWLEELYGKTEQEAEALWTTLT